LRQAAIKMKIRGMAVGFPFNVSEPSPEVLKGIEEPGSDEKTGGVRSARERNPNQPTGGGKKEPQKLDSKGM